MYPLLFFLYSPYKYSSVELTPHNQQKPKCRNPNTKLWKYDGHFLQPFAIQDCESVLQRVKRNLFEYLGW